MVRSAGAAKVNDPEQQLNGAAAMLVFLIIAFLMTAMAMCSPINPGAL